MKRSALSRTHPGRAVVTRTCAICGEDFESLQGLGSRKYCGQRCNGEAKRLKAVATYPPRDEIVRLYEVEKLSDVEVGRRYGRSYQWAFKVRYHYRLPGRAYAAPSSPRKESTGTWRLGLKPEPACRNCGRTDRRMHLHHAIPRSVCRASKADLRNGLPLCSVCHSGWHHRRNTIYRDVFTEDEWAYISTVELLGQRIEAWLEDHYPDRGHPFRTQGERCGCGVLLLRSGECPVCFDHEDRVA